MTDLAAGVVEATEQPADFKPLYQPDDSIMTKLNQIVKVIYGGKEVELSPKAQKQIAGFEKLGWDKLPVIVAKTQYSLTDDAKKIGKPEDFVIHIREFVPKLGAGFLVAMAGNILTMPGLPKDPAANHIKIDSDEKITGLF